MPTDNELTVMVPRYIAVLCEKGVEPKLFFARSSKDELFTSKFREEVLRVESGNQEVPDFPQYVATLAEYGRPLHVECTGPTGGIEIISKFSRLYVEAMSRFTSKGDKLSDAHSPCYEVFEYNPELESGKCWRIYTESLTH